MSVFDESALRVLIAEELRRVLREELPRPSDQDDFLPVAEAARLAAVTPDTIRSWIHQGRLRGSWAGRELRVRRSELHRLLATPPSDVGAEPPPEEEARRFLARREAGGEPPRDRDGRRRAPSQKGPRADTDRGE